MQIRFDGKTQQRKILFIQGEHNQTLVTFNLPAEYGGHFLSELTWTVRTVNLYTDEFFIYELTGGNDGDRFVMQWQVQGASTASPGDLEITLAGKQGDEVIAKFVLYGATVKQNTTGAAPPQENYFELVLSEMDAKLARMEQIATHPTTVREDTGTFWVWDANAGVYVDSGIKAVGPQGPQGIPGAGLDIKGTFATVDELAANVLEPAQGDMYNVGEAAPYVIYMWEADLSEWISLGQLQGPMGPPGNGLTISGYFATYDELAATVTEPAAGDAYGVGMAEPYDIYVYDGVNLVWVNNGPLAPRQDIKNIIALDRAEYDALEEKNADTLYLIKG